MERGVREFMRRFEEEAGLIFADATQRTANSVARLAPIAEGEYLADWDIGVNAEPPETNPPGDPKRSQTRARFKGALGRLKFGDRAIFNNDDPVANRLEFGYSKQAPQGVVRLTTRQWNRFIKGAARAAQNRFKKNEVID